MFERIAIFCEISNHLIISSISRRLMLKIETLLLQIDFPESFAHGKDQMFTKTHYDWSISSRDMGNNHSHKTNILNEFK